MSRSARRSASLREGLWRPNTDRDASPSPRRPQREGPWSPLLFKAKGKGQRAEGRPRTFALCPLPSALLELLTGRPKSPSSRPGRFRNFLPFSPNVRKYDALGEPVSLLHGHRLTGEVHNLDLDLVLRTAVVG